MVTPHFSSDATGCDPVLENTLTKGPGEEAEALEYIVERWIFCVVCVCVLGGRRGRCAVVFNNRVVRMRKAVAIGKSCAEHLYEAALRRYNRRKSAPKSVCVGDSDGCYCALLVVGHQGKQHYCTNGIDGSCLAELGAPTTSVEFWFHAVQLDMHSR